MNKQLFNNLNKTGIYQIDNYLVCNIKMINKYFQYIILDDKLFYRYYDYTWSNIYQELNYINDSNYYFNIDYNYLSNNKKYKILLDNNIKDIKLFKNKILQINNKEVKRGNKNG